LNMRFSGKVCLVTGAGSGIGRAVPKQFAREGGRVTVADLSPENGNQTVQEIHAAKGEAIFAQCDVGDPMAIRRAVEAALHQGQRIDVVVNDAA
jgi:glucose 1-dehydrogenase